MNIIFATLAGIALVVCLPLSRRYGPGVFLVAICLFLPFPLSIEAEDTAGNICGADILMSVMTAYLVVIVSREGRLKAGPPAVPLALFLAAASISAVASWGGMGTAVSLGRMVLGTVIAMLVFANVDGRISTVRRCFDAYLLGCCVLSIISAASFVIGGFHASEYTLGIHKNELGPIFGCGVVTAMAFLMSGDARGKRWTWLLAALGCSTVGILFSLSRGAWIATAVAILFLLLSTGRMKVFGAAVLVLVPAAYLVWSQLPEEATSYATDVSPDTYVIKTRFDSMDVALDGFRKEPAFGVGVGLRKYVEPHNVLVLTLGEMGLVGLAALLLAFVSALYTFRLALRCTVDDLFANAVVRAATAVFLVTTIHGCMDVYWRRGVGVLGWAGVGMAVSVLARHRRQTLGREAGRRAVSRRPGPVAAAP